MSSYIYYFFFFVAADVHFASLEIYLFFAENIEKNSGVFNWMDWWDCHGSADFV
jgi:hypothetical protein